MTNWKFTVDFMPFWDDKDIDIKEKATRAAKELKQILTQFKDDSVLEEIIEDFESIGKGEITEQLSAFDNTMYVLYDWADSNLVWVKTFA